MPVEHSTSTRTRLTLCRALQATFRLAAAPPLFSSCVIKCDTMLMQISSRLCGICNAILANTGIPIPRGKPTSTQNTVTEWSYVLLAAPQRCRLLVTMGALGSPAILNAVVVSHKRTLQNHQHTIQPGRLSRKLWSWIAT